MSTAWLPQTSAGETVELNIKHYQRLDNKHRDRYFKEQGCTRVCLECNTNTRRRTCLTRRFKIFNVFSKLINSTSAWWGTSGGMFKSLKKLWSNKSENGRFINVLHKPLTNLSCLCGCVGPEKKKTRSSHSDSFFGPQNIYLQLIRVCLQCKM